MTELLTASAAAFWLGILTSISPCPLATNIAAVSYLGKDLSRPGRFAASGLLYAAGRVAVYVLLAVGIVSSLLSIPAVAAFLQNEMNRLLGPVLVVAGIFVLGWVPLPRGWRGADASLQRRAAASGVLGAGLLGVLFALSFCPISAGLFFGSLLPLSASSGSRFLVPAAFGLGTGLPVIGLAAAVLLGLGRLARAFQALSRFEFWARRVTGVVFLVVGAWFVITRTFAAGG
ncbi:MAG TPA: aromatic aminobenezylarsenical efflux permease ArsG family transporter [Candidatus Polarisedimenticolaceae bacterium]